MNESELRRNQLNQLEIFKVTLQGAKLSRQHSSFTEVVGWLRNYPRSLKLSEREYIRGLVCECFDITQQTLDAEIMGKTPSSNGEAKVDLAAAQQLENELMEILPQHGLVKDYVDYTLHSEAPLAYHVFSIMCAAGNVINRRIWFDMGYYRLYPTLGIIILGPSGIKKTSATNIAIGILQELALTKIYSEKLTPEALIDAMKGDNAVGLVYAPEMAVFLSKAQYNEGLVQLITRFMDCPDVWESGTIGRGRTVLRNVAISSAMCSTPDWFVSSTPADSFGGGFIARNLLIVQETSARCEPIPDPGDTSARKRIVEFLARLHEPEGQIAFGRVGFACYDNWYRTDHQLEVANPEHELLATYYNRKPDHAKRLAIIFHMAEHGTFELCHVCFERALELLRWTEQFLPEMLSKMFITETGETQEQVLRIIHATQPITHSALVRKMAYKISAAELRMVINSLKEARLIHEHVDNVKHFYTLMQEEK